MLPYAIPADLAGDPDTGRVRWLTDEQIAQLGDDTERVLARATELVADNLLTGYTLDDTGAPADPDVRAALRDAVCAQVEQWLEVGEENDTAGYPRTGSMSAGGVTVSALPSVLAPRARRVLRLAGLMNARAY